MNFDTYFYIMNSFELRIKDRQNNISYLIIILEYKRDKLQFSDYDFHISEQ